MASGIDEGNSSIARSIRPVLILNADTQIFDGDGTKNNPFVVE